jgi:hypothetical protein
VTTSRTQPKSVACPRCNALPGERCFLARANWRGNIFRSVYHTERGEGFRIVSPTRLPVMKKVAKGYGFPNVLQARQMIEDEAYRRGKSNFAEELGISRRYLDLVLCHERNPVHASFSAYFGWQRVYQVAPEDDL